MTTPAKPRQSGIPAPGRGGSSIPTPGRSRSSSSVYQSNPPPPDDISRAFADAIRANDPSQHRIIPPSISSSTVSLSPQSLTHSLSSGRRSVAGRPSSSASTSSIKIQERAKTPISARISSRPPSRQSEVVNKLPRTFEVGDNVRIESLGFEGTLRYVGEIDGKLGLWAGVELSGGFSGKGKNDGTVGGKQYFSCPDKCGVFVATTKLSPPTVGPGLLQRPSSVASSRGGRMTPANAGRTTPSFFSTSRTPSASYSNGRTTPSTGSRMTPSLASGRITPSSNPISRPRPFKTPTSKTNGISLSEKITEGSRASKYMTMTAKQLSSRDRDDRTDSPTRKTSVGASPTISRTLSSPTRLPGSPFSTPKALNGRPSLMGASPSLPSTRSRPSMNTPRARVPSNVSMPPPPSPGTFQTRSSTSHDSTSSPSPNSDSHNRVGHDKGSTITASFSSSRPTSSASFRSTGADDIGLVEQLQSRLEAAEYENERLRIASEVELGGRVSTHQEQLVQLRVERQDAFDKVSRLETNLSDFEGRFKAHVERIETLESENLTLSNQLNHARSEAEQATSTQQSALESREIQVKSLEQKIAELEESNRENTGLHESNIAMIDMLQNNLEKLEVDMDEERRDLMAQIDELRIAGQETIALYEERLSSANSERYELESRISSLENSIKAMADTESSIDSSSNIVSSAAQIDNETLREQVHHLQKKSSKLEEQLEDTRATLERDVSGYQDKISRIRLEDEQRKRDLTFRTREVEQLLKSESMARNRVEEIEEALRESTVALENARGEVEAFRAELTNLEILIDDATEGDITSKLANFTKRAVADKARYQQEIGRLEQVISDSSARNDLLLQKSLNGDNVYSLDAENKDLRDQVAQLEEKVSDLTNTLHDRTNELESLRKKANRDVPLTNGGPELTRSNSSKGDPVREEVAGLKHIVQELQKENLASSQQIKLLETENQLLATEAEQLRQEVRILEDDLDSSIREANSSAGMISPDKADKAPTQVTDQNTRSETELDQMRKRLGEVEVKHARALHSLNKEISELEALVESKIYREDELEQEVERLKEKLARKKTSKDGGDGRHGLSIASSSTVSAENARVEEVCEICERPGHDIFNCSLLKDEGPVVCEDCESPGHVAANCPHSQDVF